MRLCSLICDYRVELYFNDAVDRMRYQMEVTVQRLVSELETGGNVRYEDGRPTDMWYVSQPSGVMKMCNQTATVAISS